MSIITASVGQGGVNRRRDVRIVEFLLNKVASDIYPELAVPPPDGSTVILAMPVDGEIDERTIRVISDFQERLCGMDHPDGRIDPNRKTIARLTGLFLKSRGGVVRITPQEAVSRVVRSSRVSRPRDAATFQRGFFEAGQTVGGFDGRRLILSITGTEAIFLLLDHTGARDEVSRSDPMRGHVGALYLQDTLAFLDERDAAFWLDVSQRLETGIQQIQDFQIDMTLGALSVASGGISAALTAGTVGMFIINNREMLAGCLAFLETYLRVRRILMARAPRLCEKVEAALLRGVTRGALVAVGILSDDVFGHLEEAADTPGTVGKLVGVLAGIAGSMLAGRFGAMKAVFELLKALLVRAVVSVPGAVRIAVTEKLTTAREIAAYFQDNGVPTTLEEGQLIVEEVLAHPQEVRAAIEDLAQAAVALRATAH